MLDASKVAVFMLAVVICALHACRTGLRTNAQGTSDAIELLVRVEGVSLPEDQVRQCHQPWLVTMTILKVLSKPDDVSLHSGDCMTLHMHSVVECFGYDRASAVGRTFRLQLLGPYSPGYAGAAWAQETTP
jgi:hypothetical protein